MVRSGASPEVPIISDILVADENDGAVFTSEFERFEMDLGDERTRCVDDLSERALASSRTVGGTVGAENENAREELLQWFRRKWRRGGGAVRRRSIVDNFVVDVDGIAVSSRQVRRCPRRGLRRRKSRGAHAQEYFPLVSLGIFS